MPAGLFLLMRDLPVNSQRHGILDVQIALRKCDFDPVFVKAVSDLRGQRVFGTAYAILRIIDPDAQV
jgi:hypothetical protein